MPDAMMYTTPDRERYRLQSGPGKSLRPFTTVLRDGVSPVGGPAVWWQPTPSTGPGVPCPRLGHPWYSITWSPEPSKARGRSVHSGMVLLSVGHSAQLDGVVVRGGVELAQQLTLADDRAVGGQRVVR